MLAALGVRVVRFRWWIIAFWGVVFLASVPFAFQATSSLKSGFGEVETESRVALRLMSERLELPESSVTLVFSSDSLEASDPRYIEAVERATAPLSQIPEVDQLITFHSAENARMVASDGRTTYAFVLLNADIDGATDLVPDIRAALQPGDELDIWVTGGVAIFSDLNIASEQDLRRAEIITLPLLLVALLIVFGGVIAAGLPLAMGGLSVIEGGKDERRPAERTDAPVRRRIGGDDV